MPNEAKPYDFVIIGGGPAGVTAATELGEHGKTVALVDVPPRTGRRGREHRHDPEQDAARNGAGAFRPAVAQSLRRRSLRAAQHHRERFPRPRAACPRRVQPLDLQPAGGPPRRHLRRQRGLHRSPHGARLAGARTVPRRKPLLRGENFLLATGSSPNRPDRFSPSTRAIFTTPTRC